MHTFSLLLVSMYVYISAFVFESLCVGGLLRAHVCAVFVHVMDVLMCTECICLCVTDRVWVWVSEADSITTAESYLHS